MFAPFWSLVGALVAQGRRLEVVRHVGHPRPRGGGDGVALRVAAGWKCKALLLNNFHFVRCSPGDNNQIQKRTPKDNGYYDGLQHLSTTHTCAGVAAA